MQENPYLQNINYKSNNQINYLAGGLSNAYPPQYIQDDECQDMYNFSLDSYPALETRIGRGAFKKISEADGKITYMGMANKYLFFIQGTTLKDDKGNVIDSNLDDYYTYKHVYYKDGNNNEYLILYSGGIEPLRYKLPLSAENAPEKIKLPSEIHGFSHMCYHKNRMIGSSGNMLYFSAVQNPTDWSSANVTGEVRVGNCNQITGLVSFDDKLIAFSEHNIHLFYGSSVDEQSSDLFTCVNLDNNIGCYSQNAIIVHRGLLYWLYQKSIYEYDGSTIRAIERPNSNNGVIGGVQKYTENFTRFVVEKGVSLVASGNKIYFLIPKSINWTPSSEEYREKIFLVFDQRLRKWTIELQAKDEEEELYFTAICSGEYDLEVMTSVHPIYAATNDCKIYNLAGEGGITSKGSDIFFADDYNEENNRKFTGYAIPFYLKTKEFKNNVLSKKISLSQLWINYDLATYGIVNFRITTDTGKTKEFLNALPVGENQTKCILIPNDMQNVDSYTIEIWGENYFRIYGIERVDRIHPR